jgi:hypothetical protein
MVAARLLDCYGVEPGVNGNRSMGVREDHFCRKRQICDVLPPEAASQLPRKKTIFFADSLLKK